MCSTTLSDVSTSSEMGCIMDQEEASEQYNDKNLLLKCSTTLSDVSTSSEMGCNT